MNGDYEVHPTAILFESVSLGSGSKLGPYVVVGEPPRGVQPGSLKTKIGRDAVIRSHTVIYADNVIGDGFQTGHKTNIRESNKIGNNVSIGTHSVIEHHVEVGDDVRIHSSAFIPEFSVLEKGAWVGPHVVFTNALHPLCPDTKSCMKGPTIRRGAKIGANSTILPDITVGEMALIGAGSVVTKDVDAHTVVVGNPARVVGRVDDLGCPYDIREKPY